MRHPLRFVGLSTALIGLACSGLEETFEEVAEGLDDGPAMDDGPETVAGQDVSAFSIKSGDCFQDVDGETVTELTVVPCTQAHDNETFKTFDVSMGSYNEAGIEAESESTCVGAFESYVGLDYDSSKFTVAWMTPTLGSWAGGDREVICILYDSVPMTGSAKGSGQ
jgi:hypothetical protein